MSWDSYLDNLVAQSQYHIDEAAIIGIKGGKWTTDNHPNSLKFSNEEMTTLCSNISNMTYFQQHGILLGSIKYQFLRGEEGGQVMAKKKGCGGITIQASNSAIVMAHCKEGGQQGNVNKAVSVIVDYLKSQNM